MAPLTRYVFSTLALFAVAAVATPVPQVAGEGAACDSVLTSTDNGVGYGVEDAEDNTANTVTQTKGSVPATKRKAVILGKRQGDKIANRACKVIDSTGVAGPTGGNVASIGDSVDGALTSGAADTGAVAGNDEASTLEWAGSLIPKN